MDNAYYAGGASIFSLVICGVALVAGYSTQTHREFPGSIFLWIIGSDFLNSLYYSIVLMPGPVQEHLNPAKYGTSACVFLIYVQIFLDLLSLLVCAIVSITLYAVLARSIALVDLNRYYYKFLVAIWGISLSFPLVSLIELSPKYEAGVCFLDVLDTTLFRVIPWLIIIIIQVFTPPSPPPLYFSIPFLPFFSKTFL
eukprot:Phypoly_transcript_11626.p1 GENE.Phypoly_transcript_11626~~Phypoly_transcript_11626.p1  ORF type:complete len:197 (-),score=4.97 Phypoly_transcript_11626:540-1130(-)